MGNKHLLYYVTGHGYGHARRSAEVIRALFRVRPGTVVHVRTMAPEWIFQGLGGEVRYTAVAIDHGAIEASALEIDWEATLAGLGEIFSRREEIITRESAYVRQEEIGLIVADVCFLAGEIAAATGVECWAQGNFTWDWIYEPYLNHDEAGRKMLAEVEAGYAKMTGIMRLPFAHPMELFGKVIDVPLIASKSSRSKEDVLEALGIDLHDERRRVLSVMRGGINEKILEEAARQGENFLFMHNGTPFETTLPNLMPMPGQERATFWDVLSVCDAVVSKLGHGIVTDCAASKTSLLWPARNGFREDPMIAEQAGEYFRLREISLEDFERGNWAVHLRQLLSMPEPRGIIGTNGAEVCAGIIAERMG